MSLLRYFKASSDTTKLPDPRGPLSTTVPSSSIESAKGRVKYRVKAAYVIINFGMNSAGPTRAHA